ncbi:molybdopterin molybdotransferase MoeA [Diplocloster modestus]|uniref:Molybdopterin molybdenumtransferase n=1 Tax=Diplocloster modestus TaxID=2850322 RepID=A0ABS6K466_9FIRM|nr:gephyrin-like molybdotransferase Glp [Diplocloster modestus]MBU9725297.1 molybdopterin molybdotransferase MoeA [Diplocloster modestus]
MKLLRVDTLDEAMEKLLRAAVMLPLNTQQIRTEEAVGRVLAGDIVSAEDIPGFRRSTVDGYAVLAQDTQGAAEALPVLLRVVEEVDAGQVPKHRLQSGQCAYVPTGGMIPEGADAMVMIEYCEPFGTGQIAVGQPVSPGRDVVPVGDDIRGGSVFLKKGTEVRAQEIGGLLAAGIIEIPVFAPFRVTVLSTGDELVEPGEPLGPGQMRDINSGVLKTLARQYGCDVIHTELIKDDREQLSRTIYSAMRGSDLVLLSGGSSQGNRDFTAEVIDQLAKPGVFTHGLALKPGKPTILGYDESSRTILAGLPGHPAAAMLVFVLLFGRILKQLRGEKPPVCMKAQMECNVPGAPGRETCQLVQLLPGGDGYLARPVFGKSGLITTLTEADGFTMIPVNREGLHTGERVCVWPI